MIVTEGGEFDRADEFLNKYRILEEELNKKYGYDEKTFGSPVVRFINDKESKPYRDKLNICREIRNFLSHHSEFDGERMIQPSAAIVRFLDEVAEYVRRPPLALDCATLYADILKTTLPQKAQTVMKKMERQGFSHVPVIDDGECVGVFSVSTVFTYALLNGMAGISDDMIIADFSELLPADKHSTERFRFVGRESTINDVRGEFERKNRNMKRLAAVFITDNGSSKGRILGMLTPHDVINY
ncbi:MAG: CBS domain-containing protein [Clostridia bacterium]|nr:CBS domain-containing protein [Clostridia bacterium]